MNAGAEKPRTSGLGAVTNPTHTPVALDADVLAQEIRRVDGNHELGAGALAEAIMPFLRTYLSAVGGEAGARKYCDGCSGYECDDECAYPGVAELATLRAEVARLTEEKAAAEFAVRNGESLSSDVIHEIRELLKANDVPLAPFIDDHVRNAIVQRDEARSELARLKAQPGVVKALEWRPHISRAGWLVADTPPGGYFAWELAGLGYWSHGSLVGREVHGGIEEAKAAAQADYERRIISALSAPVSQAPVAWRWAYVGHGRKLRWTLSTNPPAPQEASAGFCGIVVEPLYASPHPITEGEPSDAEGVKWAADRDLLAQAAADQNLSDGAVRSLCLAKIGEVTGEVKAWADSALLAAKSKGGQADG